MYSSEVLSQLRRLNWLLKEARLLEANTLQRNVIDSQIDALRASLPVSLLKYHDERAKRKLPSIAKLSGSSSCGNCHLKLPSGTLNEIAHPGSFGICPNCGVFVWAESATEQATASAKEAPLAMEPAMEAKPRKKRASAPRKAKPSAPDPVAPAAVAVEEPVGEA